MIKRVILVDDHRMFLDALLFLLKKATGIEVVGIAQSGPEALQLAEKLQPDIVCMDIGMPGMNGIEATRKLKALLPTVKVIALSTHVEHAYVSDMMKAGASAYVSKTENGQELLYAIQAVLMNRTYWCPSATESFARTLSQLDVTENGLRELAARERQVLRLVAEGFSSQAIADQLNIALGTVEVHRRNIMRKLGLHSAVEMTRYAIKNGLLAD